MKEYNPILGALFSGKGGEGGYNAGFRQSRLAALYQNDDPEKQAIAAKQLAAVDPEAAGKWQQEQAKVSQERLERQARMFASITDMGQKGKLYTAMLPEIRKNGWADAPDIYTSDLDNAITAWAGTGGSQQQAPAKVQEAEYFANASGFKKGTPQYNQAIAQYMGVGGNRGKMSIAPDGTPYIAEDYKYWDGNKWIDISPEATGGRMPPPATNPPPTDSVPPPVSSGGKTIVTPQDIQGAAQRTGAVMQQVRAEIAELIAQGVPADQATSQVTQKYAQGRGLTMPSAGQQPAPVQQPAQPVAQTAPPPVATGGQGRGLFAKPKEASRPATAAEKAAYGIPADVPAERKADGSINVINLPKNDQSASIANETTIRKEFAAQVKPYQDVISAYKRVESAASSPTAAGDLSMIFAYMKMLDPGSVVREGEFANAQNATGVPGQVVNLYNRVKTGQRLSPEQRADFLNQARKLKMNAESSYKQYERQYRSIAEQYKIPPDRILVGPSVTTQDGELDFNSPDPLGMFK